MARTQGNLAVLYLLQPDVLEEHPKDITGNEDCATCGCVNLYDDVFTKTQASDTARFLITWELTHSYILKAFKWEYWFYEISSWVIEND